MRKLGIFVLCGTTCYYFFMLGDAQFSDIRFDLKSILLVAVGSAFLLMVMYSTLWLAERLEKKQIPGGEINEQEAPCTFTPAAPQPLCDDCRDGENYDTLPHSESVGSTPVPSETPTAE